jgi:hypothetical protein
MSFFCFILKNKLSIIVHICNSSAWVAEAGGSQVWGQPGLHSEFKVTLTRPARHCLNKTKTNTGYTLFSLVPLLLEEWQYNCNRRALNRYLLFTNTSFPSPWTHWATQSVKITVYIQLQCPPLWGSLSKPSVFHIEGSWALNLKLSIYVSFCLAHSFNLFLGGW